MRRRPPQRHPFSLIAFANGLLTIVGWALLIGAVVIALTQVIGTAVCRARYDGPDVAVSYSLGKPCRVAPPPADASQRGR